MPPTPTINHIEYWKSRWRENRTEWHMNDVHPTLIQFLDCNFLASNENESLRKVFVPLCGKTRDMVFLLSLGFEVFGVEGVQQPIDEFTQENSIELKFNKEDSIYETEDGRLKIYLGDLFKCPIEKWGPFDCIWDRGSLIAIEYQFRSVYLEMMKSSLKKKDGNYNDFQYLLDTVKYDKTLFGGPPRSVDEMDMDQLFSEWTNSKTLVNSDLPDDSHLRRVIGSDIPCKSIAYLLTKKHD